MKTALVFSGQGSQYVGMLKDIYEHYQDAKSTIEQADDILGYKLSEICFEGPVDVLRETRYTQPALFLHSAVVFDLTRKGLNFDAVAGHSVGEYAALYAAGVLKFEDALKLVSLRGKLMFKAGEDEPGTMFAVINLADDIVEKLCAGLTAQGYGNVIVPANYNSPGQIVISGSADYLRTNAQKFKDAGARMVKELQVSGAFHSPLLKSAKEKLERTINSIEFSDAIVPVYANVTAEPVSDGQKIKELLIKQLLSPVKWTHTVINMHGAGITNFIEMGPGNVLQGLIKRTLDVAEVSGLDKAVDLDKFIS